MSKNTKNTKNTKASDVTTMVPNAEGQLEVVEQSPLSTFVPNADGVLEPQKKSRKKGKRELNLDDPFMKQTIVLKRQENPKRKGSKSAARFELYKTLTTVADFIKAGGTRGDINWDVEHEHIELKASAGVVSDVIMD